MQHARGGDAPDLQCDRLPIVGVLGSGTEPHSDRATILGRWLGTQPVHLLTGGGGGTMETVSRAFHSVKERAGSHGTASEVRLALQYEKPLVAFLSDENDIPDLPSEIYVEPVFEKVKEFVRSHIS